MGQDVLTSLLLAIVIARLSAYLLGKFNAPPIASYMLVGIALGPSFIGLFQEWGGSETLVTLSLLFLLFYAGLNVDFRGFKEYFKDAVALTISSVALTMVIVFTSLVTIGYSTAAAIVIAVSLSNTATEIVVLMLEESRMNDDILRRVLISASFFDDVLAVVMISLVRGGLLLGGHQVFASLIKFLIAFTLVFAVSLLIIKKFQRVIYSVIIKWSNLLMLATVLFFGLSYVFGIAGIGETLGAYLAGLVISMLRLVRDPTLIYVVRVEELVTRVSTILEFFIIPVFFIYVGCKTLILNAVSPTVLMLLALALIGKFVGSMIPFAVRGDVRRGVLVGVAMNVRGSLEPAVALTALEAGVIDINLFDSVVTVSLLTSLIIPIVFTNMSKRIVS